MGGLMHHKACVVGRVVEVITEFIREIEVHLDRCMTAVELA